MPESLRKRLEQTLRDALPANDNTVKQGFPLALLIIVSGLALLAVILSPKTNIEHSYNSTTTLITTPQLTAWRDLSDTQQQEYLADMFILFPELLDIPNPRKYDRARVWLQAQGIHHPNIRDLFSSGGRVDVTIDGVTYTDAPAVYGTLAEAWPMIKNKQVNTQTTFQHLRSNHHE